MAVSRRLRGAGLSAWACAVFAAGSACAQPAPTPPAYSSSAEIQTRFPTDTGALEHGARVKLRSGSWVEITDNPFGPAPPALCWYAPSLHAAGFCLTAPGVNVMVLVDLNTGHRVTAPGYPSLMPGAGLIAIGPDAARQIDSDSVTLVRVDSDGLTDEGGALFDEQHGPGGWIDADCYKLTGLGGQPGGWLERDRRAGWVQVEAGMSTVCQGRHGQ